MRITPHVKKALEKAIEKYGKTEVAKKARIHVSQPGKYISGKTQLISDANWEGLYPVLKEWLPRTVEFVPAKYMDAWLKEKGLPTDGSPMVPAEKFAEYVKREFLRLAPSDRRSLVQQLISML
jgi:hypothetical protein